MTIKTISKDQIGSVKKLWEELNAHHFTHSSHFKDYFSRLSFDKRMNNLTRRERFVAFVAETNNEPIGYCIATVYGGNGEIDSLFVNKAYRKKGLGKELVSLALQWLEEQNCETILVYIAEGNENVLNFYRGFGFAERFVVMQKRNA